jgi:hypothetical protein
MDWEFLDDVSLTNSENESDNLTKSLTVESEFEMLAIGSSLFAQLLLLLSG